MPKLTIQVANQQADLKVDARRLARAVHRVLRDAGVGRGSVSVAVVDDTVIRSLNARYLDHDYATDVLSFVLERDQARLEGEIIVSAETAGAAAPRFSSNAADELLLYAIHGALHLVGYRDDTKAQQAAMREKERYYLRLFCQSGPMQEAPRRKLSTATPFRRRKRRPALAIKD
jgi:probable rRNA maturation factor